MQQLPARGHQPAFRTGAVGRANSHGVAEDVIGPQARQLGMEGVEQEHARSGPEEAVDLVVARRQRHDSMPSLRFSGVRRPRGSSRWAPG
jgi:hypothetical protein